MASMGSQLRMPAGVAATTALLLAASQMAAPPRAGAQSVAGGVEARVWLGHGERPIVQRGDRVRLYYRTTTDAYVALFHVDTDGIVRMLHPRVPDEDHYVRGGRDYRLLFPRSSYWQVDDDPGVGYFFMIASRRPLDLSDFRYAHGAGGWDLSRVGRRVYRDPYVAMDDYVAALVPGWRGGAYALDFVEYHVGRSYRYPRFVCYDCHGFRPYRSWNPYRYDCHSFRIVIHTDPYYYPVYRYRGTRVVYARPPAPNRPRFTFKERAVGEPASPVYQRRADATVPGVQGTERRRPSSAAAPRGAPSGSARPDGSPPVSREPDRRRPSAGAADARGGTPGGARSPASPADRPPIRRDADDRRGAPGSPPRPVLERRSTPSDGDGVRPSDRSAGPSDRSARPGSASPPSRSRSPRPSGRAAPRGRSPEAERPAPSRTPSRGGERPSTSGSAPSAGGARDRPAAPPGPPAARGERRGSNPSAGSRDTGGRGAPERGREPRRRGGPDGS